MNSRPVYEATFDYPELAYSQTFLFDYPGYAETPSRSSLIRRSIRVVAVELDCPQLAAPAAHDSKRTHLAKAPASSKVNRCCCRVYV